MEPVEEIWPLQLHTVNVTAKKAEYKKKRKQDAEVTILTGEQIRHTDK